MRFMSLVAALLAASLVVAGCGGGGGGTGTTSSQQAFNNSAVKFSQCMREHGIPNFPDPTAQGNLQLKAGPGTGIDPQSAQFKAAHQACQKYSPKNGATFDRAKAQQMEQAALKFAQCMRAHGVNFPDPQFRNGGAQVTFGGPGINPNDPKFKAAQQACSKDLPQGGAIGAQP